jgi:hypothetical protein
MFFKFGKQILGQNTHFSALEQMQANLNQICRYQNWVEQLASILLRILGCFSYFAFFLEYVEEQVNFYYRRQFVVVTMYNLLV